MLKKYLAPNRLAVYFTAFAALAVALVGVLGDLDFQSTAAVIGSLAVLAGVVAKWLSGWQQYESALQQADLIAYQANVQADLNAQRLDAAKQVSAPGSGRKVQLPR